MLLKCSDTITYCLSTITFQVRSILVELKDDTRLLLFEKIAPRAEFGTHFNNFVVKVDQRFAREFIHIRSANDQPWSGLNGNDSNKKETFP